jgi:hypothetical protein
MPTQAQPPAIRIAHLKGTKEGGIKDRTRLETEGPRPQQHLMKQTAMTLLMHIITSPTHRRNAYIYNINMVVYLWPSRAVQEGQACGDVLNRQEFLHQTEETLLLGRRQE